MKAGSQSYGIEQHVKNYGLGIDLYRGESFAQPAALMPGDVLASGAQVMDTPVHYGRNGVKIDVGLRYRLPSFLPLQLLTDDHESVYPPDLQSGDILVTGDVLVNKVRPYDDENTIMGLAGPYGCFEIYISNDLPIAVSEESLPVSPHTPLGALAISNFAKMQVRTRRPLVFPDTA